MFEQIRPKDWKSARALAQDLFGWGANWGFRGHSDASWKLVTTFERAAGIYEHPAASRLQTEDKMLKHFKRRAHLYLSDPPAWENELEWLALIQHYGGPTRLLDFSRSFYVAAFFATERAESDAAVWAIKIDEEEGSRDLAYYYKQVKRGKSPKMPQESKVSRVEPERMNQRLSIQQGFFLFPHNISVPFIDNLAGTLRLSPKKLQAMIDKKPMVKDTKGLKIANLRIVQIILGREIHKSILSDLKAMNVTSESLFPGLDGFARSLFFHLTLPK